MSLSDRNRALIERAFSPETAARAAGSEGGAIFSSVMLDRLIDAVRAEGRLNYAGALSDLDSCLEVLIRRINGEADLASAAEWVRLNYPHHAAKLNPAASKGEGGK